MDIMLTYSGGGPAVAPGEATLVLEKPFTGKQLVARVAELLDAAASGTRPPA